MLKSKAVISIASKFIIYVIGFFSSVIVARLMGPEPLGVLSTSQAFVNIFGVFGGLGFGMAHFKRVSEGMDLGKCNGTFFTIRLVLSFLMLGIIVFVYYLIYWTSGEFILKREYLPFFWIVVVAFTIGNIESSIQSTFTARLEVTKNNIILISKKLLNTLLKVLVAISGLTVIYLAWSYFTTVVFGILLSIWFFRKYPIKKFDWKTFKSYWVFAAPITIVQFLDHGAMYVDKVFLTYFVNETQTGFYSVAQSFTNILLMVSVMFINLLVPVFSKIYAKAEYHSAENLVHKTYRIISLLITPIVIFIFVFSENIIFLFYGSEFEPSIILLQVLILQIYFNFLLQPFSSLLIGSDKPKLVAKLGGISAGSNMILNLILIPDMFLGINMLGLGAKGAAIALLISVFIRFFLFRYFSFSQLKIRFNFHITLHLAFGFGIVVLAFLLKNVTGMSNLLTILIGGSFIFILYYSSLWLIKEFDRNDVLYFLELVNFKNTTDTMKSEFKNNL